MRKAPLLLVVALALTGCTHLPWKPYRGWRAWKTANISIYTDTLSQYEPALDWLEAIYGVYQGTFFRDYQIPPADVLYLSSDMNSPFLANDGTNKYGLTLARLPWAEARNGRTLVVVGYAERQWHYHHQLAHHFIEHAVPRAPLWFHEGLARYLTPVHSVPERPGSVCYGREQPMMTTQVTLPLKELLATGYRDYNEKAAPWVGPLSQSFIDFLMHGESGRLRPRFFALMRALAEGKTGEQALAAVYPELPLDQMDARFREHVRTPRPPGDVCPLPFPVNPSRGRIEPVKTMMDEAEVRALFEALEKLPDRNGYGDFAPETTAAGG